jgi:hypothetical protein
MNYARERIIQFKTPVPEDKHSTYLRNVKLLPKENGVMTQKNPGKLISVKT